jgi:hypothetical protein
MNDRYARYGAATGVIAVILMGVGFSTATSGIPDVSAAPQEWGTFFADNQSQIQVGMLIVTLALFAFLWFAGSVRSAIAIAEGPGDRLASIALAGAVIAAGSLLLTATALEAAAFRTDAVDAVVVRALADLGFLAAAPGVAGLMAFLGATAIAGYRHGAVPAPIAGFSALGAITQPLALGIAFTDSGAFAADGVLGFIVPIVTFSVAVIALSVTLYRRPVPAGAES